MIGKTNVGGGGGNAFAYIGAVYPVGATCTCTNGTKTFTAKGTGGLYVFYIPYADDWTVTATDGTSTTYKTITITNQWQNVVADLSFWDGETLFDNGDQIVSATGGWAYNPNVVVTASYISGNYATIDNRIGISIPTSGAAMRECAVQTLRPIDLDGYSGFEYTNGIYARSGSFYLSYVNSGVLQGNYAVYKAVTNAATVSINFTAAEKEALSTAAVYPTFVCRYSSSGESAMAISKLRVFK